MSKSQPNLQDMFLNQVRRDGMSVTIYLSNGVQLRGSVRGFDSFTVILDSPGRPTQLVYKHSITSVVPSKPINLFTNGKSEDGRRPRSDRHIPSAEDTGSDDTVDEAEEESEP